MECICLCEKFNPHNLNHIDSIIVDETEMITSPAYLYTFKDKSSNEKYCVVSDHIGIPLPYLKTDREFVVATSRYIYFFDTVSKNIERKSFHSPCAKMEMLHNKIIVICECDVAIISCLDKRVVAEFAFDDVIIDYQIQKDSLLLYLMEGTKRKIDI